MYLFHPPDNLFIYLPTTYTRACMLTHKHDTHISTHTHVLNSFLLDLLSLFSLADLWTCRKFESSACLFLGLRQESSGPPVPLGPAASLGCPDRTSQRLCFHTHLRKFKGITTDTKGKVLGKPSGNLKIAQIKMTVFARSWVSARLLLLV